MTAECDEVVFVRNGLGSVIARNFFCAEAFSCRFNRGLLRQKTPRTDSSGCVFGQTLINMIRTTSDNEDFKQLIQLLDADLDGHYGNLPKIYDQYNVIDFIETIILAYDDQIPAGCGGFKKYNHETVEIKRMFVKPKYRGKGIASRILQELEIWAIESGYSSVIPETGEKQVEAIRLYQKKGDRLIENYGPYKNQPTSGCFEKQLRASFGLIFRPIGIFAPSGREAG